MDARTLAIAVASLTTLVAASCKPALPEGRFRCNPHAELFRRSTSDRVHQDRRRMRRRWQVLLPRLRERHVRVRRLRPCRTSLQRASALLQWSVRQRPLQPLNQRAGLRSLQTRAHCAA
jgi:hypothetical protein